MPAIATRPRSTDYSMGYTNAFLELLHRRTAERNSSHLLPFIRPDMHILDLGSGPGNITRDLATYVPLGTVTGIDCNIDQVGLALRQNREAGAANAHHTCADATDLPFPNDHFDVVHCHAFLMHTPSVRTVLEEALRVLRPGGIISSRDMDVPSSYISPASPSGPTIFDMLTRLIRQTGGTPTIARHLKTFFANAGFTPVTAGATSDFFDSPDDISFLSSFLLEWALSSETEHNAVDRDIATPQDFATWRTQLHRWSSRPTAVGCFYFGHALGRKPH